MDKSGQRLDILALNLNEIKKSLPSVPKTKLVISKDNIDSHPLSQNVVKSWTFSLTNQVFVSRNKVGRKLLQHCRYGFHLDDPHIYQSRFYVDYHRLHDPALKRYHNSVPVKNRLAKLQMISKQNDAICTQKEFTDYLRYIDSNLIHKQAETRKREESRKLSNNFHKLEETKRRESKYVGIFRHEKHKREPKSMAYLDKEKRSKANYQLKKVNAAIERASNFKNDKAKRVQVMNLAKEENFKRQMQIIIQTQQKRKIEMHKNLDEKLKQAQKRKQSLQTEKRNSKMKGEIDHFSKHLAIRQENITKNIEIFQLYEQERRANVKERKRKNEIYREKIENKGIKAWNCIYEKERKTNIVDQIMKNIEKLSDKYMKTVDPNNFEEVSRRFSMLTRPLVMDCLKRDSDLFRILKMQACPPILAARTINMMELRVLVFPCIGNSKCEFVREKIADIISKTTIEVIKLNAKNLIHSDKNDGPNESEEIIDESPYIEFMGSLNGPHTCLLETHYNLNKEVRKELMEMFKIITKCEFNFSDMFKTRDFIHLYDFQKYILYKSIRCYIELVKMEQHHYWTEKNKIPKWKTLDLNLDEISFEAALSVMSHPSSTKQIASWLKKICIFICIEVDEKIQHELYLRRSAFVVNED